MIKFFRHIRYNLLNSGKTGKPALPAGKYLKYAIGEIILVVIGILIALSINNWNEYKKDRGLEKELLTQLKSEFQSNLNQLDQKIALRNDMISASFKLLDYIDHPEKRNRDSIITFLGTTVLGPTFDPIVNDIISSGRIQLLGNNSLKEKLSRWTSEIIQVTEEENVWVGYRSNEYVPYLIEKNTLRTIMNQFWKNNTLNSFHLDKNFKTKFNIGNSKKEINFSELLDDPIIEDYVSQCASFSELTNSQSFSLRERIVEILEIIEQELNTGNSD